MVFVGGYINPCCNTAQFNVSDSGSPSNSYVLGKNEWFYAFGTGHSTLSQYCAIAAGNSALTVTASMPFDVATISMVIAEYSGTTCTVDGVPAGHTDPQNASINVSTCDAGNISTSHPNDVILTAVQYSNSTSPTDSVSSPWIDQARTPTLSYADRVVTTAGIWNASWAFAPTPYSDSCLTIAYQASGQSTGSGPHVDHIIFRSLSQNTVAGSNFSLPSSNAPVGVSVEGINSGNPLVPSSAWNFGTLSFAENATSATAQSVQGVIYLNSSWSATAGISLQNTWRAASVSGAVVWQIQGQCVASGQPGNFSGPVALPASNANTLSFGWTNTGAQLLTTNDVLAGCSPGSLFLFRMFRDAQQPADTLSGPAELVSSVFGVTQ